MFKTRFISMLVLLMTAVTGAVAQEESLLTTILNTGDNASFKSGSKTFDNIATVTFSGNVYNDGDDWGWYSDEGTLTVTAAEGYTITRVKFYANTNSGFDEEAPFEAILVEGRAYITKVNGTSIGSWGVTKIEVYGYADTPEPATVAVTGVTLAPTSATLTLGETETVTLIPTVLPDDATDKTVTWTTSDASVATVADGVVTAQGLGTATITATATNGTADTSDDVTATCTVNVYPWAGSGTADDPFQIQNVDDWNTLAANVTGGETYSGIYFKMTDDIIGVTTRTGKNSLNPFSGTFDGQGHTMNLNIYTTNTTNTDGSTSAPFGYISGATIKNLHITGSETIAYMRAASIAGFAENSTITNCWSEVALTSSYGKDIDCGAFVATVIANSSLTLNGCLFTGTITYTNAAGYEGGGMVGYTRSGGTATLNDCLFAPAGFTVAKYSGHYMFVGGKKRGVLNNCYYNDVAAATSLTKEGKQAFSIVKGDEVSSLAISGEGTEYSVSGITAYATGIKYNDVYYAGSGEAVGLTLSHADREGYTFSTYAVTGGGTLTAQTETSATLSMTDANQTINATWTPAYAVTIDDAGVDTDNWQATPAEQKAGQTVTLSYSGKKKVKSITIEAAPAATDLSTINANYTANDGETLTGTLGSNVKISIADGATVTLNNVNIIGTNDDDYGWAGITCVGDATIILNGTNTVKGFYEDHPGIYVPVDHTVTIKGSGSLTASSNGYGCGIGGGYNIACGNIEIQGGTVMATGVADAAGIGSGYSGSCGTITISGGTVTATGGTDGAGIGSADDNASCGAITIEGGNVMATGGVYAAGIGSGGSGGASCGTITISGGNVTAIAGTAAAAIGKSSNGTCTSVTINSDITSLTLKNSQGTGIVSDFINATAVNAGENDITYMLPTSVTDPTITGGMTSAGFATSYNSGTKTWTITKN